MQLVGVRLIYFTLYSRSYCHLCEQMLTALRNLLPSEEIAITVVDVDNDPVLVDKYDELVPVLLGHNPDGSTTELCHYFIDPIRVQAFCLPKERAQSEQRLF